MNKELKTLLLATSIFVGSTNIALGDGLIKETKQDISDIIGNQFEQYLEDYTIKKGDTIESISKKFLLTKSELIQIRKLTESIPKRGSYFLVAGKTIKIPNSPESYDNIKTIINKIQTEEDNRELNELYKTGNYQELEDRLNFNIYPNKVEYIGFEKMGEGLLGNMKYDFDPVHPLFIDKAWQKQVNCAGTIKAFYSYSKNIQSRTKQENKYINKIGVDAWELPEEFIKIGYTQKFNLMNYFDKSKIGNKDIIKDKQGYNESIIEINNYLKTKAKPGDLIPIYFTLSSYKHTIKQYNQNKTNPHYNTHQTIFLGNGEKIYTAKEQKNVINGKLEQMTNDIDILNFVINFIQQRSGYKSAISNYSKKIIKNNLLKLGKLVEIKINGEKVNFSEEILKNKENRLKINKNDDVVISGPVLLDGFHNVLSENKYIQQNNHTRTRFFFEGLCLGTFTVSELLINPNQKYNQDYKINKFTNELKIQNLYYLKQGENINLKLREAILKHKFNKINDLKNQKITEVYDLLTKTEKKLFRKEYTTQIKGLQLMGYIQNEGNLNKGTVNVNAPIPYFDSQNIGYISKKYIAYKKSLIDQDEYKNDYNSRKFINIVFFPGDNKAKIYTQISKKLKKYQDKYPIFDIIQGLNPLQKNNFLDKLLDTNSNNKSDISNGKIESGSNIILGLENIKNILEIIKNESVLETNQLSKVDEFVINKISKTKVDSEILSHILAKESYEKGIPYRKIAKKIKHIISNISSYGDMQTRFKNLNSKQYSLKKWPSRENLLNAIDEIQTGNFDNIIERRKRNNSFKEIIEKDLSKLVILKSKLSYIDEENRLKIGNFTYKTLEELFRFDDGTGSNILGKILQVYLVKDKIKSHSENLNNWFYELDLSLDNIDNNKNVKKRYYKTLLEINKQSESIVIKGILENYLLRILKSEGVNINSKDFPELELNFKGSYKYKSIYKERLIDYKKIFSKISDGEIKTECLSEINILLNKGISIENIFSFLKNKKIIKYLESKKIDTNFLPTTEEFENKLEAKNNNFRNLFFAYSRTPKGMLPPKIDKIDYLSKETITGTLGGISALIGGILLARRKRKKKKIDTK